MAFFRVPAFVASLGIMMVASGFAYMLSGGLSIYQLPDSSIGSEGEMICSEFQTQSF